MRYAGAALNQIPIHWENNRTNILEAISLAQEAQVDFLCLPELTITGYGCEDLFLSKWVCEKSLEILLSIVPQTEGIVVSIGLPISFENNTYNCVAVISDKKIVGISAKQHLANDGIHYEPRWFTAWRKDTVRTITIGGEEYPFGDLIYDVEGKRLAFEICEDAWRDTRPGKRYSQQGVDLIFNPSASHFAFGKTSTRKKLVIDSSREFSCTYVYSNLLGNEAGKIIYDGEVLISQQGSLLNSNKLLSFDNVNLVVADDDEFIHVPEILTKNQEFEKAVSLALFDYLRKAHTKSYVLSLSGGADSSACAVLVAQMIRNGVAELGIDGFSQKLGIEPEENEKAFASKILYTAYQGTKNSSTDTFESAKGLAESLGASFYSWLIDDEVDSYTSKIENVLGRKLEWHSDDIALQNIQARTRSPIIWMLTNITKSLLITTSNRSEGDVGYATMDGDTSGSIGPIAGVDKHFIREWLLWAQGELGYSGLDYVNNLQPSAELRPLDTKQTDEEDLMPYPVLALIERLAIFEYKSPIEVYNVLIETGEFEKEELKRYLTKFFRLWSINQWKRERLAPSFHLDDFNVDPRTWCRFPILSGAFSEELIVLNSL